MQPNKRCCARDYATIHNRPISPTFDLPDPPTAMSSSGKTHSSSGLGRELHSPLPTTPSSSSPKIAIPRVSKLRPRYNRRVKRACSECRQQKTKCNGHQPCTRCISMRITCAYADPKKERMKRLQELEEQVQAQDRLLDELQPRVSSQDRKLIASTRAQEWEKYPNLVPDRPRSELTAHAPVAVCTRSFSVEYIQEDFHRDKTLQAIGYMGGPSEMSWINELYQVLEKDAPFLDTEAPKKPQPLTSVCYFLDDEELVLDPSVDLHGRPPRRIADKMLDCYFFTVHPSFPIIAKIPFMQQYDMYYKRCDLRPTKRWLAVLNLVFALATKFAQLVSKSWASGADSPLAFFTRARKLSFTESQLLEHPDLQQVQVEGLTAFFLMGMGHVNRSWRACGVAVRSAIALGINLRSESKETSSLSKEIRCRVWWSIYTLENTLSIMTGRPTCVPDKFSTTPLPIPFDEEKFREPVALRLLRDYSVRTCLIQELTSRSFVTSTGLDSSGPSSGPLHPTLETDSQPCVADIPASNSYYFFYFVDLTVIMRRAIDSLYSPGFARQPWLTISAAIMDLVQETDAWLSRVPSVFQFRVCHPTSDFERQRWSLAFRFYSLRIALSRPALCRSERQRGPDEASDLSQQRIVSICVDSALELLDLLPDKPDALWLIQVSPWWCVLHYLMQSVTVLLIEIEFRVRFHTDGASDIMVQVKKGLEWLYSLGSIYIPAKRAWGVCSGIFNRLLFRSGRRASLVPDMRASSPKRDSRTSDTYQPRVSPGFDTDGLWDDSNFMGLYVQLPHGIRVHPDMETPYDEIPLCKNTA